MKTFFPALIFITFTITINAQTNNSLVFKNVSVKYKNMERTGTILTAAGGLALFTGNILYWKVYNERNSNEPREDKASTYGHIMLGGLGLMAIGIPLWATGKSKLRRIGIEARLVNFKGLATSNSIGINLSFNLSQLHSQNNN